jgi:hypothetical protein
MESSCRFCVYCEQDKVWIFSGLKLKDGSRVFVDQDKARWAGKRCPDCEKQRVQSALKCNSFEKDLILYELQMAGYTVTSTSVPLKVEKDGLSYQVSIKRAFTRDGKIILEHEKSSHELQELLFQSVRIIPPQKLATLHPHIDVYAAKKKSKEVQTPT